MGQTGSPLPVITHLLGNKTGADLCLYFGLSATAFINRYQRACSTEAWPDPASPRWGGGRGCEEVATGLEGAGNVVLGGHWTCVLPNPPKKIRSPFTHWYLEGSTQILLNFHVPKTEQNRRDTSPFVTFYKCTGIKKLATLGCIILPVF